MRPEPSPGRSELFVDTSAWYPLTLRSHPDHDVLAAALRDRIAAGTIVVTTNLVVAETHVLLLRRAGRAAALDFVRELRRPPMVVVESSTELEEAAVREWLVRYTDQDFSMTDAVSFATMRDRAITEALALDRHFTTAGFTRVPAG